MHSIYSYQRLSTGLIYKKDPKTPNFSFFSSLLIVLCVQIGIRPLFFGGGFRYGFWFILILIFVTFVINTLPFFLLTKCWIYGQSFSYITLWESIIGQYTSWIPELLIVLGFFISTMEYFQYAPLILIDIIYYFIDSPPSVVVQESFITYVLVGISSLIICCAREIHFFIFLSYVKFFCMIIITLVHIIKFATVLTDPAFSVKPNYHTHITHWDKIISFVCFMSSYFNNNICIEHIVQVMKMPTYGRTSQLYLVAAVITVFVSVIHGLIGALMFGQESIDTPIYFYFGPRESGIIVTKICEFIYLLISIYLILWIEGRHLCQMFAGSMEFSKWTPFWWIPNIMAGLVVIFLNASTAFMPNEIAKISKILGNIGNFSITFLIPSVFYLKMYGFDRTWIGWSIASVALIIIGSFLLIFSVYDNIKILIKD